MDISKMSKVELLRKCKELCITNYSSKNKSQLIELIHSKQKISECNLITGVKIHDICQSQNITISNDGNANNTVYTFIEVCAGGGGLSTGLIKAGFTPILLNDNNTDCCKTLKHNHPDANVVFGSMDNIDYSPFINKVDLLTGGVVSGRPCSTRGSSAGFARCQTLPAFGRRWLNNRITHDNRTTKHQT